MTRSEAERDNHEEAKLMQVKTIPEIAAAYIEMNRRILWLSSLVLAHCDETCCDNCNEVYNQALMCYSEAHIALTNNGMEIPAELELGEVMH